MWSAIAKHAPSVLNTAVRASAGVILVYHAGGIATDVAKSGYKAARRGVGWVSDQVWGEDDCVKPRRRKKRKSKRKAKAKAKAKAARRAKPKAKAKRKAKVKIRV